MIAAADQPAALAAMRKWIASIGTVEACAPCAKLQDAGLYMKPDLDWIADDTRLGADFSADLQRIFRNRLAAGNKFSVSLANGIYNPVFDHEPAYPRIRFPDAGFQLLGLSGCGT